MRYRKEREGYLIRLDIEEKVEESLIDLTRRDGIDAAHFWGIGAVKDIVLGYYDLSDKTYRRSDLPGTRELVSLTGSLAQTPEGPILHIHAVLADEKHRTVGGHVFSLTVAATVEIYLTTLYGGLMRRYDDRTGLKLLDV